LPGITPAGLRSRWHVAADVGKSADSATDLESEHRTDPCQALWYTNTWNTGYLPINSNVGLNLTCVAPQYLSRFPQRVFDNTGNFYNVSNAVGSNTLFNQTLYENYSPA
jgi:hypothetical protein